MKKIMMLGGAVVLLAAVALLAGCGGDDANAMTCTSCGAEMAAADAQTVGDKAYCGHCAGAAQQAADAVATHDCAGACGMKAVPETQLTKIEGKWYCKGCKTQLDHDHGHEH